MKKKLKIDAIEVKSFVTQLNAIQAGKMKGMGPNERPRDTEHEYVTCDPVNCILGGFAIGTLPV